MDAEGATEDDGHGRIGLFNEWYQPWVYEQTLQLDGTRQRDLIIRDPGYPDPFGGQGSKRCRRRASSASRPRTST